MRWITAIGSTLMLLLVLAATAAATPTGQVYAWGWNEYGEIGNGAIGNKSAPQLISGLSSVTSVASGYYQSLALLSNGTVEGWGRNNSAELGDGTTEEHKSPELIPGLQNVVALSAGYKFSVALLSNGTVETWGKNEEGQLGDGTLEEHKTPHLVPGLQNVVAISAGLEFVIALLSNGTVVGWGSNHRGELGDGTIEQRKSPEVIPGLSGVVQISADAHASLELLSNGTVKASGSNSEGELGDGTQEQHNTPVTVPGLSGVSEVSGGYSYSEALLSNGTVESWGENEYSQLGNATKSASPQLSPASVAALDGVSAIYGNSYFTLAALSDGTVKAWGWNGEGELGDGTEEERATPQTVPGISNIVAAGHGAYSYTALAVQGALATLSSSNLSFGSQLTGTTSPAQTVTLTNRGPAQLTVYNDAFISPPGPGAFTEIADGCHGVTLGVGGTCSIMLVFHPESAGPASALIAISSTAASPPGVLGMTGTGIAPPVASPLVRPVAPVLGVLSLSRRSFSAIGPVRSLPHSAGTIITYTDSQAATTTFTVQRVLNGLRRPGKGAVCTKAPRHPAKGSKHCLYFRALGSFTNNDSPGANRVQFLGSLGGKKLKVGSYRLLAVASSVGGQSAPQTASFKIKR